MNLRATRPHAAGRSKAASAKGKEGKPENLGHFPAFRGRARTVIMAFMDASTRSRARVLVAAIRARTA